MKCTISGGLPVKNTALAEQLLPAVLAVWCVRTSTLFPIEQPPALLRLDDRDPFLTEVTIVCASLLIYSVHLVTCDKIRTDQCLKMFPKGQGIEPDRAIGIRSITAQSGADR
jgi:hypothetical protein